MSGCRFPEGLYTLRVTHHSILSQATTSWELASPSWGLLGHVSHHARWPASLMPKGSWDACTSQGIATFLCAASRHSGTSHKPHCGQDDRPTSQQPRLGKKAYTAREDMRKGIIKHTSHPAGQPDESHDQAQTDDPRLHLSQKAIEGNAQPCGMTCV